MSGRGDAEDKHNTGVDGSSSKGQGLSLNQSSDVSAVHLPLEGMHVVD